MVACSLGWYNRFLLYGIYGSSGVCGRCRVLLLLLLLLRLLRTSQTELSGYVHRLHEELPLPLVLYTMPGLTKVTFEVQTLAELIELPKLIAIKDSSGDLDYFGEVHSCSRSSDLT